MPPVMRELLPVLALGLAACAPGRAPPPRAPALPSDDAGAYFPLAVGNSWTYLDRSPQLPPGVAPRRSVRIVARDAEGYYVDSDRGALRVAGGCVQDRLRRILCAPFTVGSQWTSVVSLTSTERYEIAAVGETVRVPAGSFEGCVRVRARNRAGAEAENVLEISYAPGVGPVRIETSAVTKGVSAPQVRAELESYRVEGR